MGTNRSSERTLLDDLIGDSTRLLVRQKKEWGEILIGFESRNRFEIFDEAGRTAGFAAEEGTGIGQIFLRNFLGRMRAAKVHIYNGGGEDVGRGEKPFRFYFHRMEVFDGQEKIGAIQRKFSILHRLFTVEDASGQEVLQIKSPFFRIWTFKLLVDGQEVGRISKKWGGILREAFTDADTFGVEFSHPKLPQTVKKLLLVAVFLVDFVCFEGNSKSGVAFDLLGSGG